MRKGEEDFKAGLFLPPIITNTNLLPAWLKKPTIEKLQPRYDTTWEKQVHLKK